MTQINLLPWREHKREQDKRMFLMMLAGGVAIAIVIVFLINAYADSLVSYQTQRNQLLQKEITILDRQIEEIKALKKTRQALVSRMSIIQNLQSTRTMMVHLFDELIKVVPSGIYVTKLERQQDIVTLTGFSESNTNVSILMRSIEADDWIQNPVLTEIQKVEEKKQAADNEFKLSFILKPKY